MSDPTIKSDNSKVNALLLEENEKLKARVEELECFLKSASEDMLDFGMSHNQNYAERLLKKQWR